MLGSNNRLKEVTYRINRLGAIRDAELSMNQFMLFSGDSGLGKSYMAVLSNYIFQIMVSPDRLGRFLSEKGHSFNLLRKQLGESGEAFRISRDELESWMSVDAVDYLKYMFNTEGLNADISIALPIADSLAFSFKRETEGIVDAEDNYLIFSINDELSYRIKNEDESVERESSLSNLLRLYLIHVILGNYQNLRYNFILPPSRGALMTEMITPFTGLYAAFVEGLERAKAAMPVIETQNNRIKKEFDKILDGEVYRDKLSGSYLYKTEGVTMPISAAASSIRELAPLSLLVKKFNMANSSLLFEEPEAHLHSLKQRMVADLLSLLVANQTCIQMTTHSDYLLRRLNELVMVYRIVKNRQISPQKKKGMPKELALDPNVIGAYYLKRREDRSVKVVRQDVDDGIGFDSFYAALRQNLDNDTLLSSYLQ